MKIITWERIWINQIISTAIYHWWIGWNTCWNKRRAQCWARCWKARRGRSWQYWRNFSTLLVCICVVGAPIGLRAASEDLAFPKDATAKMCAFNAFVTISLACTFTTTASAVITFHFNEMKIITWERIWINQIISTAIYQWWIRWNARWAQCWLKCGTWCW